MAAFCSNLSGRSVALTEMGRARGQLLDNLLCFSHFFSRSMGSFCGFQSKTDNVPGSAGRPAIKYQDPPSMDISLGGIYHGSPWCFALRLAAQPAVLKAAITDARAAAATSEAPGSLQAQPAVDYH